MESGQVEEEKVKVNASQEIDSSGEHNEHVGPAQTGRDLASGDENRSIYNCQWFASPVQSD